jgi:small conductance mechanosensitive channel
MSAKDAVLALLIQYGFQAAGALVILVAGLLLARWIGNFADRWLAKQEMEPPIRMLLGRGVRLIVMLLVLLMVLQQFGIQILPLVAGLGVLGVGIGLALQGVLRNVIAGFTIIFTKPFRVGEYIDLLGVYGEVQEITIFSTKLLHDDRSRVIIPNRKIIGEILHNYGHIRQLSLNVGVSYDTNLTQALEAARQVVQQNPRVIKDLPPVIGISVLGDSSVGLSVKPWVSVQDFGMAQAEIYEGLLERFKQDHILIPFPQHEVRLISDFGPVGS